MTASVDRLVRRLEAAGRAIEGPATRDGVNAAAKAVAAATLAELAKDTHGTFGLRGVPKSKLGVVVKPSTGTKNHHALVRGVPKGLWTWLAAGTKPHIVGSGRGRTGIAQSLRTGRLFSVTAKGGRSYTRKLMAFGGIVRTGPWVAGGSPAKHTFGRGVDKVRYLIPGLVRKEEQRMLAKTFRHG